MRRAVDFRRRGGMWGIALLLALLAVVAPVIIGPLAHAQRMHAAALLAAIGDIPVCHEDDGGSPDTPRHPPEPDCAICPLCVALAHPAIAWTPAPRLPAPTVASMSRPDLPPGARAPPSLHAFAAQPRGPPTLV